jgi:hypothetical protein
MSIIGTGIYGATPQWARIGAIMVVCSCHDALAADQLPPQIVGVWCLTSEGMLLETYAYRRCKDHNWDIIVYRDGFDAQETSCNLNRIERQGAAWLASLGCSGAGLSWLEDDKIRVSKDGWTLEAKIKNVRRVGDPNSLLLGQQMLGVAAEVVEQSADLAPRENVDPEDIANWAKDHYGGEKCALDKKRGA